MFDRANCVVPGKNETLVCGSCLLSAANDGPAHPATRVQTPDTIKARRPADICRLRLPLMVLNFIDRSLVFWTLATTNSDIGHVALYGRNQEKRNVSLAANTEISRRRAKNWQQAAADSGRSS